MARRRERRRRGETERGGNEWKNAPTNGGRPGGSKATLLVQKIRSIQRVALLGDEAGIADDAAEFLFAGPVVGAGGGDHVLFDHDAAYVVAAETQAHLAGLQTLRHPTGLHILEVVEIDAADGQGLQVLH